MRVLFVDDEPRVLEGIENLLFGEVDDWQLLFASTGSEALAILDSGPIDVIVTDMCMPGMDGEALLNRVRLGHPSVVRIVLSGQSDRTVAERCLRLVHDFVSKPCSARQLIETVASARDVAKSADTAALRGMLGRLPGLPSAPGLHVRLQSLIDAGADQRLIAEDLSQDIGVTVQLLHIANSAFYGFRTPATSLAEAVPRLGLNAVSAVVLATDGIRAFGLYDSAYAHRLNRHATRVAGLLNAAGGGQPREALTAMVHDVGRMVLLVCCGDELTEVEALCATTPLSRCQIERQAFGFDHSSAGGYLLRLWRIDPAVARAVEFHHRPWDLDPHDPARPLALRVAAADHAVSSVDSPEAGGAEFADLVSRFRSVLDGVAPGV